MASLDAALLVASTVTFSAPLVLAALGGLTSERSGVMNIALEGGVLAACCGGAAVGLATGSPLLGALGGIVAAVAMMLLHAVLTQAFAIDQIISGMAVNAIAIGGTSFVNKAYLTPNSVKKAAFFPVSLYWVIAVVAVVAIAFVLARTRPGLRLLAVGNDPDKSRQMGVDPVPVRYGALLATGLLCGLSGLLIVSNAGSFTDNMTAGRGFIALAALIIGGWRPWPALAACVGFGMIEAVQLHLQGTKLAGANVPTEFWTALPYVVTLVALAGLLGKNRAPAGLGKL